MAKNDNPTGFYDKIDFPSNKKDEVAALFSDYKIIEHTSIENEYNYLEDTDLVLEIVNPYRAENLFIEFAGEFTLYFSDWHSHYDAYEYDFIEMKNDALAIVSGKYAALCFYLNDECFGCKLFHEEVSYFTDPNDLIREMDFPKEHIKRIRDYGVVINIDYWKPNDCWEFEVEKVKETAYTFPRRYGVRYAVKEGISYGSGSQKKYDNDMSMITYVDVEPITDEFELKRMLIRKLEQDAKKSGAKKIFSNIADDEYDLFMSLGYAESEKIDNDTVHRLCGCIVGFDKTVIKTL